MKRTNDKARSLILPPLSSSSNHSWILDATLPNSTSFAFALQTACLTRTPGTMAVRLMTRRWGEGGGKEEACQHCTNAHPRT